MFQLLKCLKPAAYMLVEQSEYETWHHMALNFDVYTHFTSPIRRYMDLIVHRLCTNFLNGTPYDKMKDEIFDSNVLKEGITTANNNKKKARQSQDKAEEIFFLMMSKETPFRARGIVNFINNQEIEVFTIELRGAVKTKWKALGDKYKVDYKDHDDTDLRSVTLTKLKSNNKKDKKNDEGQIEEAEGTEKTEEIQQKTLMRYDEVEIEILGTKTYPIDMKIMLVF